MRSKVTQKGSRQVPLCGFYSLSLRRTHLITGDIRNFGPYFGKKIQGILVLPPGDYLKKI
jgi:hypothetical protein